MAIKKCKECGNEISSNSRMCPKCGNTKVNETKESFIILGVLIIIIVFVVILSVSTTSQPSGVILSDKGIQIIDNTKFELIGETTSYCNNDGNYVISGKVKQKDDTSYEGLSITFTMYDKDRNKVRSTVSNISIRR